MGALPTRDGDSPIARVEFFNRGPSLSDEVLKRVFQPGFSADKQRRGLGLGLAIARRFVEAHGGSIVAEPCREGFKVILALPREERTIDDNPHGE
jgi:signal transduction histidine kinase